MGRVQIAVYDSGVGGLTILRELTRAIDGADFFYYADQAHAPYGERTNEDIRTLSLDAVARLMELRPAMVVVACNTVTSVAIADIRAAWPTTPIVGTQPAIKPAAAITKNGRIAVLATLATLNSTSYQQLKNDVARGVDVFDLPRPDWVRAIEHDRPIDLTSTVTDLTRLGVDTVVLGCTHFPLIADKLASALPNITLVDSGAGITRRVNALIGDTNMTLADVRVELATSSTEPHAQKILQDHWERMRGKK